VNRGQKEAYKRDYAAAKADGKPFFPYAVYKDLLVASLCIGVVIILAVAVRVKVGEPINPASTDYVPRPEWYFYFLFELLRIFKGQNALTPVIMATFIIPNILMVLLIALPFYDRGPERRIQRRPIALLSAAGVIFFMAYLTYLGATAPEGISQPGGVQIPLTNIDSDASAKAGLVIFTSSVGNCTSCHQIKGVGAGGPGPNLTNEGQNTAHTRAWHIKHLKDPQSVSPGSIMPSYASLSPKQLNDLASLLTGLGTKYK
jgi:ubiquinol-cytochrome c reductase cytochrome b subunit/menaquinol-cytochrome c reductase cytochrome b/c subunit